MERRLSNLPNVPEALIAFLPRSRSRPRRVSQPDHCCAVEAFDEDGKAVIDEVDKLVLTEPLPSMPIYLWGTRTTRAAADLTTENVRQVDRSVRFPAS